MKQWMWLLLSALITAGIALLLVNLILFVFYVGCCVVLFVAFLLFVDTIGEMLAKHREKLNRHD